MAVFSRIKNWVSNEVLTSADLNAEFNNILANMKPAGIEGASANAAAMQATADPGGVGTESLATDLLGEIQRLRYVIKRLIGGAQWYSTPAIPRTYISAVGQQISNACGDFTYGPNATYADVTNLSVSITTTGKPVYIGLIYDTAQTVSGVVEANDNGSGTNFVLDMGIKILRGATTIYTTQIYDSSFSNNVVRITLPLGLVNTIDVPSAGTYTYKMQVNAVTGGGFATQARVRHAKLIAYEIA